MHQGPITPTTVHLMPQGMVEKTVEITMETTMEITMESIVGTTSTVLLSLTQTRSPVEVALSVERKDTLLVSALPRMQL